MGAGMPKAYSRDLRERVITAVETGASRREAAERDRREKERPCDFFLHLIKYYSLNEMYRVAP